MYIILIFNLNSFTIYLAKGHAKQSPIAFIKIKKTLMILNVSSNVVVSNLNPFDSTNARTNASLPAKGIPNNINGNK